MSGNPPFSELLRAWRNSRGFSQLELAGRACVSQRHLSFLELGRAAPSREMVDRLAEMLGLSLRQHNALRLAAGFSPRWAQRSLEAADLSGISRALDFLLARQEPYPAVVVDRRWNLLRANKGAVRLVEFLAGGVPQGDCMNLADALLAPDVLRPHLENWPEVARHFVRSIEADARADGFIETLELLERLIAYKDVRKALTATDAETAAGPVLDMHFRKRDVTIRLFTTIATLGTPRDITLEELRIESFFPSDSDSATLFESWARLGESK